MISITLRLSESLLSILKDAGNPKPGEFQVQVETGTTVRQILAVQGINPLLVPMITREGSKISPDTVLEEDAVITLYGPLAGG